ncbi:DeoR/GlpR family DNA-binding transcription regulator [Geminicoccus roseus]|uniref:DeoR/GlpR family DNA-binding transcription regulator n=1 Tax=Geminicoccus roseus TaxID=404900 RepID=UPI000408CED4|nr:DeoR/GlpR family DNA-binding transcription regulator [Geminicoccus roseus]
MRGEVRREALLQYLRIHENASVEDLVAEMRVSKMTVHRDLDRLVEQRLVRKVRGGVTLTTSIVFEGDYAYRERQNREEKAALAARIADQVEPGMAIILDDSSTAASIVPFLDSKRPLTVITNGLKVIESFRRVDEVTLISLGGTYDPVGNAFFGLICEAGVGRLRADLAVFSTSAVRGTSAYLHDPDIIRAKLAMKAVAERSVLAFDRSKVGRSALNLFAPLRDFDSVLVTEGLAPDVHQALQRDGVRLEPVPWQADP